MKLVLSVVLAALVAVTTVTSAQAATFTGQILTLDPIAPAPGAGVNKLNLNLDLFGSGLIVAVADTGLSGTLNVDFDINELGMITSLTINSAGVSASNFVLKAGNLNITGSGIGASAFTKTPPSAVAGGQFNGAEQELALNSGELQTSFGNINLVTDPITFEGSGFGTFTSIPTGNPNEFAVQLSLPIAVVDFDVENGLALLDVTGSIVASGTVVVPEPTSGLFLASLLAGTGAVVRRRRS
jgi:hypothetical protein